MSWSAFRYRAPKGQSRHHLRPRSRGGTDRPSNILMIGIERHQYWHQVFGNRTLDEIIALLTRVKRIKDKL
jgi:hypothetical protein